MVIFNSYVSLPEGKLVLLYVSFQRCNSNHSFQGEVVLAEPKGAKGEAEQVRSLCSSHGRWGPDDIATFHRENDGNMIVKILSEAR